MLYFLTSLFGVAFLAFQFRFVKSPPADFPPATLTTREGLIYELGPYQRFTRSSKGSMLRKEARPIHKAGGFALYERGRQFFIQPFESGVVLIRPGSQISLEAGSETLLQPTDFIVYNDHILSFGSYKRGEQPWQQAPCGTVTPPGRNGSLFCCWPCSCWPQLPPR